MRESQSHFADAGAVARYAEGPPRFVPGFADLHRMTAILLAEHSPRDADVLVLGAGGGLEIEAFADLHPQWRFTGVDPSAPMLALAEQRLAAHASRVRLQQGYIEQTRAGPFDAATCLLTLHFLSPPQRQHTLAEVHRRLKPGAAFVVAHASFAQQDPARSRWLSRYAQYAVASGLDPAKAEGARAAIAAHLQVLDPAQDEAMLRDAGFHDVALFYTGFAFRGWVGYA